MTDLLSSVIAAHGGIDRWHTVGAIDVTFNFSGGLLDLKGYPGHRRPSASVDAATPRTVFQRLGDESDDRWIFTANRVWIERRDGTIVEERSDPRAAFAGHVRETPWDRLHLTYFLGYAVWNYLTTLPIYSDGLRHARARGACRRSRNLARPRGNLSGRRACAYEGAKALFRRRLHAETARLRHRRARRRRSALLL